MIIDKIHFIDFSFKDEKEFKEYLDTENFCKLLIAEYGKNIPYLFAANVGGEELYATITFTKQGMPMDWEYFSGLEPITSEVINEETNIEKRFAYIMEYGVANYLQNIKVLHEDKYGVLISAVIADQTQLFVKVRNGTVEPKDKWNYFRERGMLTKDNHRIYYIPVPDNIKTAKEGIAWSWNIDKNLLPDNGWTCES